MKRYSILGAGTLVAALVSTAVAGSATAVTRTDVAAITADIYVAIDLPSYEDAEWYGGPMVWDYTDVPILPGEGLASVELPPGSPVTSNLSDWCGDVYVDIAADLSWVAYGGGNEYCQFEEAYIEVTLHGATFPGGASVVQDELFRPTSEGGTADFALSGGGPGGAPIGRMPLALTAPYPVLQSAGVTNAGTTFSAYWLGTVSADMAGVAAFEFEASETAEGAAPVPGQPTFTG